MNTRIFASAEEYAMWLRGQFFKVKVKGMMFGVLVGFLLGRL